MRHIAATHLKAAKRQLENESEEALRYACLDLRMAIECLTFDLLALYRDDVLDETLAEWRADKILAALKLIDPSADASPVFQLANEQGEFDAEGSVRFDERRFETKWAKKAYQTLGRYLHERTFIELEQGKANDWVVVRERTTAIASELQGIIDSSGWGLRMKQTLGISCDCGADAKFQMGPLQLRSRARCGSCGSNYEVARRKAGEKTVGARRLDEAGK
jgi:hypothetical protein